MSSPQTNSVEELQKLVAMLQKQLKAAGVDPETALLSLDEIKANLQEATKRLMEGDERAQPEFDKWEKILSSHPEHIEALERAENEWESTEQAPNEAALLHLRGLFPPNLSSIKKDDLEDKVGPELAKRILHKPVLRMVTMEPSHIAKIHAADLVCKYAFNGLDLRETRALYCALPVDGFQNDADGRKADWAERLKTKLKGLTAKAKSNNLRPDELINRAYPDTKAKAKRGRRKSMGGHVSSQNSSPNKSALMLNQLLQQKRRSPGKKVAFMENNSDKNKKPKQGSDRGRRNSIAAMLENKLGNDMLKKTKTPTSVSGTNHGHSGTKSSFTKVKKRAGKASRVRELASAFKRAQRALESAQKKNSGFLPTSNTNSSAKTENFSTPKRVPASVIHNLERRLKFSAKPKSSQRENPAHCGEISENKLSRSILSQEEQVTPPSSPHPKSPAAHHPSTKSNIKNDINEDRDKLVVLLPTSWNTRFGCGGVFIPTWCVVLSIFMVVASAGYTVWMGYSFNYTGSSAIEQPVLKVQKRAGSHQHDAGITDGSSKAFTVGDTKTRNDEREMPHRSKSGPKISRNGVVFPVSTGSRKNLPCGISGRPNGLKGCVFSAATEAQQLKSFETSKGNVESRKPPVVGKEKPPSVAQPKRKISKHKAWMMRKRKEEEAEKSANKKEKVHAAVQSNVVVNEFSN